MSNNDPTVDPRGNPNPVSTEFLSKTAHHEGKDGSAEQDPPPPAAQQSPRFSQASQDSDDTERDHAPPSAPAPAPVSPSSSRGLSPDHESTITDDLRDELEPFDWEELEARFYAKMEECTREEERIGEEFREWVELFKVWSSTTMLGHGGERARKRLRTRIASVQGAEQQFEEKRQHYIKVVQAFESALALLGGL